MLTFVSPRKGFDDPVIPSASALSTPAESVASSALSTRLKNSSGSPPTEIVEHTIPW